MEIVKDINLDELCKSYDWAEVFGEGTGGNTFGAVDRAPGSTVSTDPAPRADVAQIVAAVNGENDESEWLGVFLLNDGRYLVAQGSCDYTGWDCQASNNLTAFESLESAVKLGLTTSQAERLGLI